MNFSWKIDESSVRQIQQDLKNFDRKMRSKISREALKEWGQDTAAVVKANMGSWDSKDLKKHITYKIKVLKKGRGIWAGVGIKSGVKLDSGWAATKARWYNDGWTAYPKGQKSGRKGKNWRNGLRGQGGRLFYKTEFMDRAGKKMMPKVPEYIIKAINNTRTGKN